ncbi:MAG: outer membrane beta-barrel domain-containing protein [Gammaproteobacteria bacterium]|nr:outer membrane beta-barrel domain-containing protein [Gammaproteobacteria bacterium]NND38545.1 outer membrane beta-barrel domain-containing protein [Pseudomonadales bacterium]NNM12512.1 outer membrane beta-barrel domain-containing protein [Pseudomonadales bacterium]RZV59542.1 MAG: outer membrane beta-barrel domain-containing protein [Pseudomonadales bacterium]
MANRLYRLLVAAWLPALLSGNVLAENSEVISPDLDRREVKIARIDNENIEIGLHVGLLSIEDFDSSSLFGARLAFHLNEFVFIEGSYSEAEGDQTTFEELFPSAQLISNRERKYKSWDVSLGWNLLPNETWIFGRAFKSDVYLLTGAGRTKFGGDNWFTINLGAGFRVFLTDWMAWRFEVRDHIFNRDIFGEDDQTNNIEYSTSASIYF